MILRGFFAYYLDQNGLPVREHIEDAKSHEEASDKAREEASNYGWKLMSVEEIK